MEKRSERRLKIWDMMRPDAEGSPSMRSERRYDTGRIFQAGEIAAHLEAAEENSPPSFDFWPPLNLELPGRCTLPGLENISCKSTAISPQSATVVYETVKDIAPKGLSLTGRTAQLDLDRIGPVNGLVTSQCDKELSIAVDQSCRDALRRQLSKIAKEAKITFDEQPKTFNVIRIEPKNKVCAFTDNTGVVRKGKIVNLSQIDILIRTAIIPARDSRIIFQDRHHSLAKVVRSFEIGFVASFYSPIPTHDFSTAIRFGGDDAKI